MFVNARLVQLTLSEYSWWYDQ